MLPDQLQNVDAEDFALPRTRSLGQGAQSITQKHIAGEALLKKLRDWPVAVEYVVEAIFLSWLNFYSPQQHWLVSRVANGKLQLGRLNVDAIEHLTELASACKQLSLVEGNAEFAVAFDGSSLSDSLQLSLLLSFDNNRLVLDYDAAAIDDDSADQLICHLQHLLKIAERTTAFKNLDLLSAQEKETLIHGYNQTSKALSLTSVTESLRFQAAQQGEKPALLFNECITSFADLYNSTGLISTQLQLANASQVVGVFLPRSDATIAALVGIWRAGRAYLPLPVDFPAEQLVHMCVENNVEHILVGDEVELPTELAWANSINIQGLHGREIIADKHLDMDAVAAVMYTSGSTGLPKGVRHTLRSLLNRFGWWQATYPALGVEVFSQRTAVSFIPSLWEMVSGIVCGKPLVIISDLDARNPDRLAQLVREHRITRLAMLPSFLRLVLSHQEHVKDFVQLRYLTLAGEAVSGAQVREILTHLPNVTVINDYGCTEVNGILSCDSREPWSDYDCLPAGRAIANCQAFILNPAQQLVPLGVIGELYLGGVAVTEGYVGQPQLNREKFIELDLGDGVVRRLYRTHDRAKRLADGRIQILGRNDNVVKIRGIRIELEAVENALVQLPEIAAAAAACQKTAEGITRLVAYVIARDKAGINASDILQRLAAQLPDAMVPSRLLVVDALPKTANGKLNRAALKKWAQDASAAATEKTAADEKTQVADAIAAPTKNASLADVLASVLQTVATTSGFALNELNLDAEFRCMGIDSANAVLLMDSLSKTLERKLPVTLIYECATPRALATHIVQQQQQVSSIQQSVRTQCGNIAVIGMACRMPQADNLEAFWQNLVDGKNCVGDIPAERWDWKSVYSSDASAQGKTNSRWGGFINGIAEFDPLFFNISASEAKFMAPEQRILLQACWHAIEDAGYAEQDFYGRAMGVFVGARPADYMERLQAAGITPDAFTLLGNDNAILAARIAYYLNLKGPVITIDTACSSSAVAIHMACESLRRGESEIALAGGISLVTTASQYIVNTKAGMVSPDGSCKTFDARANGFVQGEGCGVLVLKPLEQAIADNDRVYAVIHASGINQDGKTNGITAPNGDAQMQLISSVYRDAKINPADIHYIETHGTGTKLGDPIEFNALTAVYAQGEWQAQRCALGAVKTNIGHLIAAAGVAGFIKAAQALYHKQIPANLHYRKTNEHIDLESSPFFVNTQLRRWESETPRMAALSSFGFSGTNCHLVLREAPNNLTGKAENNGPVFLVLSAKDSDGLKRNAQSLLNWLQKNPAAMLPAVAYTYARRLNHFKHNLVCTAQTYLELTEALQAAINDEQHPRIFRNDNNRALPQGRHFGELADAICSELRAGSCDQDALDSLASLLVSGLEIKVRDIYAESRYPLFSVPAYEFEKGHYWVEGKSNEIGAQHLADLKASTKYNRNLVAQHKRDLDGNPLWSFTIACKRSDFAGHKIGEQIWWPAAAQLQVLTAAVAHLAAGENLHIKEWLLLNPLVLDDEQIAVELLVIQTGQERAQFELIAQQTVLSKGVLRMSVANYSAPGLLDVARLAQQCRHEIATKKYYADFASKGIHYGPEYRRLVQIRRGKNQAMSWVSLPREQAMQADQFQVELLDAALHSLAVLQPAKNNERQVPVAIDQMLCLPPLPAAFGVYATITSRSRQHTTAKLWLFNEQGKIFAWIDGIQLQTIASETSQARDEEVSNQETIFFTPRWFDEPVTLSSTTQQVRLLGDLGDESTPSHIRLLGRYKNTSDLLAAWKISNEKIHTLAWHINGAAIKNPADICWQLLSLVRELMALPLPPEKLLVSCAHHGEWNNHVLALAGALRSLAKEYPQFSTKIVHLLNPTQGWFAQELADAHWQTEIHRVGNERLLGLWEEHRPKLPVVKQLPAQVSLITGGLGGVGIALAKQLSSVAGSGLVLVGRRNANEQERELIQQLRREGAEVVYWQADVSDYTACERLMQKIARRFGKLDAIYHCAGVTRDAFLINKTSAQVEEVFNAKVVACENLDKASGIFALKHLVLFSSITSVLGTLGQSDYGTANAWLDNFARNRNANPNRNGHCIAINWPLWAIGGMRPDAVTENWLKENMGMHAMPAEAAFAALQQLLADQLEQAMVLYGERKKLTQFVSDNTPAAAARIAVGS